MVISPSGAVVAVAMSERCCCRALMSVSDCALPVSKIVSDGNVMARSSVRMKAEASRLMSALLMKAIRRAWL